MDQTKFCVDCNNYEEDSIFRMCTQGKGDTLGVNVVTGEPIKRRAVLCSINRSETGQCKPKGLLFEPKKVVTVPYKPSFFDKIRSLFTNKE